LASEAHNIVRFYVYKNIIVIIKNCLNYVGLYSNNFVINYGMKYVKLAYHYISLRFSIPLLPYSLKGHFSHLSLLMLWTVVTDKPQLLRNPFALITKKKKLIFSLYCFELI